MDRSVSQRISIEIYEQIIDALALDGASSLKECATVCWAFVPRCRSHIFRSVTIGSTGAALEKADRLSKLFATSSDLADYVRELNLVLSGRDTDNIGLIHCLNMFGNLVSIKLKYLYLFGGTPFLLWHEPAMQNFAHAIRRLCLLPTIRSLVFYGDIRAFPTSLIRDSAAKSLRISFPTLRNDDEHSRLQHPQVEDLELGHDTGSSADLLVEMQETSNNPPIDLSSLKAISLCACSHDDIPAARLLSHCHSLSTIALHNVRDCGTIISGLYDFISGSLPTLHHLTLGLTIEDSSDMKVALVLGLANQLEKLGGRNKIRTVQLDAGVHVDGSDHFDVPKELAVIDELLVGDGWPTLEEVTVSVKPESCSMLAFGRDLSLTLQHFRETCFPRLSSSRKVVFRFLPSNSKNLF
ncbi:hypothetical protein BXZ70DRAFT_940904 [Cristinia sonorae]|uniref:F-box domain-containing protein n=1 Tax=Cristinia sonorae TaxID=1940300 RepID=A0A8K0XPA1_9AGAR|nr:hypothetical protein BXZ70DRAFT_940904 [Cristinia sonorae]